MDRAADKQQKALAAAEAEGTGRRLVKLPAVRVSGSAAEGNRRGAIHPAPPALGHREPLAKGVLQGPSRVPAHSEECRQSQLLRRSHFLLANKNACHLYLIAVIRSALSCEEFDPPRAEHQETLKRYIRDAALQEMTQLNFILQGLRLRDRCSQYRHDLEIEKLTIRCLSACSLLKQFVVYILATYSKTGSGSRCLRQIALHDAAAVTARKSAFVAVGSHDGNVGLTQDSVVLNACAACMAKMALDLCSSSLLEAGELEHR